jgi:hypothetical protein
MLNLDAFIINPTTRIDIGQTDIRESVKRKWLYDRKRRLIWSIRWSKMSSVASFFFF